MLCEDATLATPHASARLSSRKTRPLYLCLAICLSLSVSLIQSHSIAFPPPYAPFVITPYLYLFIFFTSSTDSILHPPTSHVTMNSDIPAPSVEYMTYFQLCVRVREILEGNACYCRASIAIPGMSAAMKGCQ